MKIKSRRPHKHIRLLDNCVNRKKEVKKLIPFLLTKMILLDKKEYSDKNIIINMGRKTRVINYIKIDIKNGIRGSATLETEIYLQMQLILHKITGKYWTFDKIINFLVNWFVFAYKKDIKNPICFPFKRKYTEKRYDKLKKFHESFNIYYKRMMYSWGEDKPI